MQCAFIFRITEVQEVIPTDSMQEAGCTLGGSPVQQWADIKTKNHFMLIYNCGKLTHQFSFMQDFGLWEGVGPI